MCGITTGVGPPQTDVLETLVVGVTSVDAAFGGRHGENPLKPVEGGRSRGAPVVALAAEPADEARVVADLLGRSSNKLQNLGKRASVE